MSKKHRFFKNQSRSEHHLVELSLWGAAPRPARDFRPLTPNWRTPRSFFKTILQPLARLADTVIFQLRTHVVIYLAFLSFLFSFFLSFETNACSFNNHHLNLYWDTDFNYKELPRNSLLHVFYTGGFGQSLLDRFPQPDALKDIILVGPQDEIIPITITEHQERNMHLIIIKPNNLLHESTQFTVKAKVKPGKHPLEGASYENSIFEEYQILGSFSTTQKILEKAPTFEGILEGSSFCSSGYTQGNCGTGSSWGGRMKFGEIDKQGSDSVFFRIYLASDLEKPYIYFLTGHGININFKEGEIRYSWSEFPQDYSFSSLFPPRGTEIVVRVVNHAGQEDGNERIFFNPPCPPQQPHEPWTPPEEQPEDGGFSDRPFPQPITKGCGGGSQAWLFFLLFFPAFRQRKSNRSQSIEEKERKLSGTAHRCTD
jgi:hypothetical protein